jgi:hypothetical protein
MRALKSLAEYVDVRYKPLPSGRQVHLLRWFIRFPTANPPRLADKDLPQTYRSKPLVQAEDESLFGELAILHYLRRDGWDGVWVDAFHSRRGRELFWQGMPDRVRPFDLSQVPHAYEMYRRILDMRGGKIGGFFDVLAWMGPRLLFVEYKGKGDRPNANESAWIDAALDAGVLETEMLLVVYP